MNSASRTADSEQGYVLIFLFILMIPMMIGVVAFTTAMSTKTKEYRVVLYEELALLAAEAGIDTALYRGNTGTLVDKTNFSGNLGPTHSFVVEPTHLLTDGLDNDGDGLVDEDDENIFQLIVTGTFQNTKRRIAAYLGRTDQLPPMASAITTLDPTVQIDLNGTAMFSGRDTNMDGSPGPVPPKPGLATQAPGSVPHLLSELDAGEQPKVTGLGPAPSLGLSAFLKFDELVASIKNSANVILTSAKYSKYHFGSGLKKQANVAYREGDVRFAGNTVGAGVLLVTGDLKITGTFRFDGVIIVLGKLINTGTTQVRGSIIQGRDGREILGQGSIRVQYSSEAIKLARSVTGRFIMFNGWQEISRN